MRSSPRCVLVSLGIGLAALVCAACGGNTDQRPSGTGGSSGANANSGASGRDAAEDKACSGSCPATYVLVNVLSVAAPDGAAVAGVQVSLSGPLDAQMFCSVENGTSFCRWPPGPVSEGAYTLTVTAPGFQELRTGATVTLSHFCGCVYAQLEPSAVVLTPSQ